MPARTLSDRPPLDWIQPLLRDATTNFVARLRARDPAAWFELWETFAPVLRSQLARWGRGRIGAETVKDLSQETLTALASAIDRHDPSKGARFSTWLLAIARYTPGGQRSTAAWRKSAAAVVRAQSLEGDPGQLDSNTRPTTPTNSRSSTPRSSPPCAPPNARAT